MEDLSRLVSASLAQNGVNTALNYQRLEWSRWFRCESSFSVLLAPSKPGIFALGEEMMPGSLELQAPALSGVEGLALSSSNGSPPVGKRMLALFEIAETGDLGTALGSLFLPGSRLRQKLESGNCFARYTVIEDPTERASAYAALRRWMEQSADTINPCGADTLVRDVPCGAEPALSDRSTGESGIETPVGDSSGGAGALAREFSSETEPSVSFALETEVRARRSRERFGSSSALPSGF